MYKRLAEVRSDKEIDEVRSEPWTGTAPCPTRGEPARGGGSAGQGQAAGLTDVNVQGNYVRFAPVELLDSTRVRLDRVCRSPSSSRRCIASSYRARRPGAPLRCGLSSTAGVIDDVVSPSLVGSASSTP